MASLIKCSLQLKPDAAAVRPGRKIAYIGGSVVVVFVLSYVVGTALSAGSVKAVQTACAVSAVLSGYLLNPLRSNGIQYGNVSQVMWPFAVCVAGGLAVLLAAPATGYTSAIIRIVSAVFVMLFFLEGLTAFVTGVLRDRSCADFVVLAFVCLAALSPLWLGPWIEIFVETGWFTDLVVAISPLTYIAAMMEYDYLRDQWFYTHAPYGGYRFSYPGQFISSGVYISLGIACRILAAFAWSNTAADRTDPSSGDMRR